MSIVGHKKQIKYLNNILKNKDSLPHAFLFVGPEKIGKRTIALEFIKSIQCEKSDDFGKFCGGCSGCRQIGNAGADFLFIDQASSGKGQEIGISSVRELKSFFGSRPIHGRFKVAVIDNANNMTIEAQNALLKILEEPSGDKLFFLLCSNPDGLLKTIVSRVCPLRFFDISKKETEEMLDGFSLTKEKYLKIKNILPVVGGKPGAIKDVERDDNILDDRRKMTEDFFRFVESDLDGRFNYIERMIKMEDFNLSFLLENWMVLAQEALFQKIQKYDLMNIDESLREFIRERDVLYISKFLKSANAIHCLIKETNANQRLAFEMLAISL